MSNLIGKLFGSNKALESADNFVNKVSGGIDKAFFTREEKSDFWLKMLAAYQPFKLAQRLLALMITAVMAIGYLIAATLYVCSIWFETTKQAEAIVELTNAEFGTAFTLIIGFYFAGGMAEGIIGKVREKNKAG